MINFTLKKAGDLSQREAEACFVTMMKLYQIEVGPLPPYEEQLLTFVAVIEGINEGKEGFYESNVHLALLGAVARLRGNHD